MSYVPLFLVGLCVLLVGSIVGALLWVRYYHDDANNTIRRIAKNSGVPFAVRLIIRVLEFGFALILYSTLPVDEIGKYTLAALLIAQYLVTFSEFGLGILLTREVAKEPHAAPHLFNTTLTLRWLFAGATIPIAAAIIGAYQVLGALGIGEAITPHGQSVIWILLLTLFPGAYSSGVTALYNAHERMEVPAFIELVTAIMSTLLRIGLLLAGYGIVGIAWAAVAISTLTAGMYAVLQRRTFFVPRLVWDSSLIRSFIPLAFPLMLNNLLNIVFFRFDTFIIKATGGGGGDALVQQYAVAYQFINIALVLPPVITFAIFPLLSRRAMGNRVALAQAQNRTLAILLMLALPIAMGMSLLAPDLIALITRRNAANYLPISAHVLAIVAWFLPLSFVNGLLQYVLIAINHQKRITMAFLVGALFNLTLNLIAIPVYGLYAASVITILSEVVLFAVFVPLLRRESLAPPLLSLAWRPTVATVCMGVAMYFVYPVGWYVAVPVAAIVYGMALWLVGAIGAEERALLARLFLRSS